MVTQQGRDRAISERDAVNAVIKGAVIGFLFGIIMTLSVQTLAPAMGWL